MKDTQKFCIKEHEQTGLFSHDTKNIIVIEQKKKRHFRRLHLSLFSGTYTLSALAAVAEGAVAGEPEDFFT